MSKVDKSGEINCNISSNGNVKKKTHRTSKNSFREKNTKNKHFLMSVIHSFTGAHVHKSNKQITWEQKLKEIRQLLLGDLIVSIQPVQLIDIDISKCTLNFDKKSYAIALRILPITHPAHIFVNCCEMFVKLHFILCISLQVCDNLQFAKMQHL